MEIIHKKIMIEGIVQGVGFRPFIHRLVEKYGIRGWVRNTCEGAEMEVEGRSGDIALFLEELRNHPPTLAVIDGIEVQELPDEGNFHEFTIIESRDGENMNTLISPDIGICPDCRRELFDPSDRRYRYPFINCTNCGPRFTIIRHMPYDREKTSMSSFPMCRKCGDEYRDIRDRRYHAQPDCCSSCGPKVFYADNKGRIQITGTPENPSEPVARAVRELQEGKILAIKGIGGFHLACDPENRDTVERLRRKKERDGRPFALMCKDIEAAERFGRVGKEEKAYLKGCSRPIVLIEKKEMRSYSWISNNPYLGILLPYTPIHELLFLEGPDALIMTSANISEEPIISDNQEALEKLKDVADGFLLHNRDIVTKCDDSLLRVVEGKEYFFRRSRGYVPRPVTLPGRLLPEGERKHFCILACGAEQKATFAFLKGNKVFLSQHIGDLKNSETLDHYEEQVHHFQDILAIEPVCFCCDKHPDYLSTEFAENAAGRTLPLIRVQHHHAHMMSCMADNELAGPCIGIIWDGTGYGEDGTIWGGEFLVGDYSGFSRMGSIRPIPLAGGDKAVRDIWRIGAGILKDTLEEKCLHQDSSIVKGSEVLFEENEICDDILRIMGAKVSTGRQEIENVFRQIRLKLMTPYSSGMGRLFDGVSAILGLATKASYEGEGAVLLEARAYESRGVEKTYPVILERGVFDYRPMIREILRDLEEEAPMSEIAMAFHNTLTEMALTQCLRIRQETGIGRVVLSGGSFQNMILLKKIPDRLRKQGFQVYIHHRVSTNDEGISLGQIMAGIYQRQGTLREDQE